jgi:hypothetical protein
MVVERAYIYNARGTNNRLLVAIHELLNYIHKIILKEYIMPTGYTYDIENGISFKEYALSCARAFGACVDMRDEPRNTPIPEQFPKSDYYSNKIGESKRKLEDFITTSQEELLDSFNEYKENSIASSKKSIDKMNNLRNKYEIMLAKVRKFEPPSTDHDEYKKFMESQITSSIDFDCNTKYYVDSIKRVSKLTFEEWHKEELKMLQDAIEYNIKHDKEENERVDGRNKWIKQLRAAIDKIDD